MRALGRLSALGLVAFFASVALGGCGLLHKAAADVEEDPTVVDDTTDADADLSDADAADDAGDGAADVPDATDAHDAAAAKDAGKDAAHDVAKAAADALDAGDGQGDAPDIAVDAASQDVPDAGPPVCTAGQIAACNDKSACTDDTCDAIFGCNHVYNEAACDDGSACTSGDTCKDGQCLGSVITCDDGKGCTSDVCKPSFGCIHQNATGPCDDGNICTTAENCKAGSCIGGSPADCSDGIACTLDTCDPAVGCQHTSGDGPCDDGSYCTVGETCTGGVCGGGSAALCNDGNDCTSDGCDPPSGCTFTVLSGACDDSDPCSTQDVCKGGNCAGVPLVCVPADVCHGAGVCVSKTGTCNPVNAPDGVPCNDGFACTTGDTCTGGACVGANQCDDDDVCTLDACAKVGGCSHTASCTVGGAVTGLASAGLTLKSGAHIVALTQDGPFTLSGGFGNGGNYFTTIASSPLSPPQRCTVVRGSGAIRGGNVADIAVTCSGCGDGAVGPDPATRIDVEWLANTATPAPEFMDCSLNGAQLLHVNAATPDQYCDTLIHRELLTDPLTLAALTPGKNALSCQFAQNMAWIVATVRHASGRSEQVVVYDYPGDAGGLTDAIRRNSACPGYDTPGKVSAILTVQQSETCDDGNLDEGDGCSSVCLPESCTTGVDGDKDGLDDCYETATGVFVDETHTGTSPLLWDTDGDGLGDGDELLGTAGGLNLAALGANPLRQDVFVEADWMEDDADCALHTHQITPGAEAMAVQMFANAPHVNPDGSTGIALHIDYGQGGVWQGGGKAGTTIELPPDIGPDLAAIKASHFAGNRLGYFHDALRLHSLGPTAGGIGEITGDDFIVASGGCDVCYKCQGTAIPGHLPIEAFCHELGHNLGLGHGGDSACNGKANYPSIMNYRHAYFGIDGDCDDQPDGTLDYSRGDRTPLDEKALNEADGVCSGFWIDWNNDGKVTPKVLKDLNGEFNATCPGGIYSAFTDHDDWGTLSFSGVTSGVAAAVGAGRKAQVCYDDPGSVAKRQPR